MARTRRGPDEARVPVRTNLRNYLIAGILVTAPLGATIVVLRIVLGMADKTIELLPDRYQPDQYLPFQIPGLFGVIVSVAFLTIIGFLARNLLGQRLVRFYERIIDRIPMVRAIYGAAKQLTSGIVSTSERNFSRVVLVQYPRLGTYSLAFVTSDDAGPLGALVGQPSYSVFIPTTPNPTSGFYLVVPVAEVIPTDLTVEEAFRVIISAGIASPVRPAPVAAED